MTHLARTVATGTALDRSRRDRPAAMWTATDGKTKTDGAEQLDQLATPARKPAGDELEIAPDNLFARVRRFPTVELRGRACHQSRRLLEPPADGLEVPRIHRRC